VSAYTNDLHRSAIKMVNLGDSEEEFVLEGRPVSDFLTS
jgi:hypothetical protein